MPIVAEPIPPTGTLKYEIIDTVGIIRDFTWQTSPNLFIPAGSVGLGTATYEMESEKLPVEAGNFLRRVNTNPRTMHIPIVIKADTFIDFINKMDTLHTWFDTGDESGHSPIYLKVTRPTGYGRQIACYYVSGLDGDMGEGSPIFVKYVVELYCPDPAPTDIGTVILTKTVDQAVSFSILNQGSIETKPVWTFTGPFTGINLFNVTTQKAFSIVGATITTGQTLTVDTRPADVRNFLAVYDQSGTNRASWVFPTSVFFPLAPGTNLIQITFGGFTSAATTASVNYLARYKGLLR